MLTEKSDAFNETASFLHQLTAEESIRLQCEARERYYRDWSSSIRTATEEGRKEGRQEGEDRACQLYARLSADGRIADIQRSAADKAFRNQLFREYGL